MTTTQPDTREQKLRDLRTIRDYLRDRRDESSIPQMMARAFAWEVELLNEAIAKAEAEAAQ